VEWFFACAAGGYIGLALNARLGTKALGEMLADSAPKAILIDAEFKELADELRSSGLLPSTVIGFGSEHGFGIDYEKALERASGRAELPVWPGDTPFLLTATSGTTGNVKMTVHSHLGVYTGLHCLQSALRLTTDSRVLTALPMFFATATGGYWISFFVGAEVHLLPAFDAHHFVDEVARSAITHSIVGPSPLYQVMDSGVDLAPLRQMTYLGAGGSAFDTARYMALHDELGGVVGKMYSLSEVTFSSLLQPSDVKTNGEFNDKVDTVGRPQPGSDIRVVDDSGDDVPGDGASRGEVVFAGPGVSRGYWSSPEESQQTFRNGGVYSGDLATVDEDGFLRVVDRKKDLIVTGGINVAPLEVEHAIASHPAVRAVAVIGVPHPTWGEGIHAVVVLQPGSTPTGDQIIQWASERLASVKKPRSIEFVDELPVNATGKVLRRVLREQYRDREN
jgi:acyl-CoA synthetase (AMP-forming)/AMP-acid ligase II